MPAMSSEAYSYLLSPGRIGAMEVRNRIAMTPMGTNQEREDGFLGEPILRYYEERARGGAGLIIAGVAAVTWPDGACNPNQAALSHDRFLPAWEEFARRCHRHGAKAAVQVQHAGKVAQEDVKSGRPMWVPSVPKGGGRGEMFADLTPRELAMATSAYTAPGAKAEYRVMSEDDIAFLIERFSDAAERAQRAGLDGVELHAGHGYMIQAFLSPLSNRREDRWGGGLENRARLLVEVIRAVRRRVGDGLAVWCRLDGEEIGVPGGITQEDAQRTAELAEAAGADAVHVSAYADPTSGPAFTDAPLVHEPARYLPFAEGIKKRLRIPVIAVGRIEPQVAEAAIAAGRCDFVAMGRKLLADPDLPNRLSEGRPEAARPCIYSYQCVGNVFLRSHSRCTVNPRMGREHEPEPGAAAEPKRIAVVGAGPAGLEAARILAQRGHHVVLHEREDEVGGRMRIGAVLDPEVARLVRWFEEAARQAGVEIVTGKEAAVDDLVGTAEAFVVATGAVRRASVPGAETALAVESFLPLLDEPAGARVAVVGSDVIGVKAAEALALAGHRVTTLEQGGFAPQMGLPRRWRAADALKRCGAERQKVERVTGIDSGSVSFVCDGAEGSVAADRVVWAAGLEPEPALADALRSRGALVRAVGDGAELAYLEAAVLGASRVAAEL